MRIYGKVSYDEFRIVEQIAINPNLLSPEKYSSIMYVDMDDDTVATCDSLFSDARWKPYNGVNRTFVIRNIETGKVATSPDEVNLEDENWVEMWLCQEFKDGEAISEFYYEEIE